MNRLSLGEYRGSLFVQLKLRVRAYYSVLSYAHFVFGLARRFFDARNAAPIARQPKFGQTAEHAERNGDGHNEVPQIIAVVAEKRHEGGDDFRRAAAEDRAHKKPGDPLYAVLRGVNAPQSAGEKSQKRRQANREDRPGLFAAQRGLFEFFFFGLAADANVAADHAQEIMDGAMNPKIRSPSVPVKRHLGLELLTRDRLGKQRLQVRAGMEGDFPLLARDHQQDASSPLGLGGGRGGETGAGVLFRVFGVQGVDGLQHQLAGF